MASVIFFNLFVEVGVELGGRKGALGHADELQEVAVVLEDNVLQK